VDGFILILAIIVFSIFKNVMEEAKKKDAKTSLPDVFDTREEHEESRSRALEALRRWEARQSLPSGPNPDSTERQRRQDTVRIPRPGDHLTDVRFPAPGRLQQEASHQQASRQRSAQRRPAASPEPRRRPMELSVPDTAEQTRREAYDAIRQLLGDRTVDPGSSRSAGLPVRRSDRIPAARPVTAPIEADGAIPVSASSAAPVRRPRIQGTISRRPARERRADEVASERAGESSKRSAAGLERLDSLPQLARGVMYAELLGAPLGLQEPRRVIGD
jgi:hypothetical protein